MPIALYAMILQKTFANFTGLPEWIQQNLEDAGVSNFCHFCLLIWKERCNITFDDVHRPPRAIIQEATMLTIEVAAAMERRGLDME